MLLLARLNQSCIMSIFVTAFRMLFRRFCRAYLPNLWSTLARCREMAIFEEDRLERNRSLPRLYILTKT